MKPLGWQAPVGQIDVVKEPGTNGDGRRNVLFHISKRPCRQL